MQLLPNSLSSVNFSSDILTTISVSMVACTANLHLSPFILMPIIPQYSLTLLSLLGTNFTSAASWRNSPCFPPIDALNQIHVKQSSVSFFTQLVLSPGFLCLLIAVPHWLSRHRTFGSTSGLSPDSVISFTVVSVIFSFLTAAVVPWVRHLLPLYSLSCSGLSVP